MNGKIMVGGIVAAALAAGAGLWYSQTYAYYEQVNDLTEISAFGDPWPVSNYRGIDAQTSPLKLRACFTVDWDYYPSTQYKSQAEPLVAPSWFDCFNAKQIANDLAADKAIAILAEENQPFGFSRFIVQYPDGRAFMWRQMNACGKAQFDGDDLPEGCEDDMKKSDAKPALKTPGVVTGGIGPVDVVIKMIPVGGTTPEEILQEDVTATSDNSDPFSLWACFKTPHSMGLLTESYEVADAARPQNPLSSLPCFDADDIASALTQGNAVAFVGETDVHPGHDRIVAVFNDGRAVAWNQKQAN